MTDAIEEMARKAADMIGSMSFPVETVRQEVEAIIAMHYRGLLAHQCEVSDGFGSTWPPCSKHHISLQVMRPGDARCPWCETEDYADGLQREATEREAKLRALVLAAQAFTAGGDFDPPDEPVLALRAALEQFKEVR